MSTFSAPLPDRYHDVLDWYDETTLPEAVGNWIDRWTPSDDPWPAADVGFSLLGPPGSGKTTTACWSSLMVQKAYSEAGMGPLLVGYVTSLKYQHALQERISIEKMAPVVPDEDAAGHYDRHENIIGWSRWLRTRCHLLIFDDWGKEHTTHSGFIEDEIEFLLRDRFDNGLGTILTSNMGLNSIKARFGESMASFIHEAFPPVVLAGDDRRRP